MRLSFLRNPRFLLLFDLTAEKIMISFSRPCHESIERIFS
jgi:hypothetical protein